MTRSHRLLGTTPPTLGCIRTTPSQLTWHSLPTHDFNSPFTLTCLGCNLPSIPFPSPFGDIGEPGVHQLQHAHGGHFSFPPSFSPSLLPSLLLPTNSLFFEFSLCCQPHTAYLMIILKALTSFSIFSINKSFFS